MGNKKFNKAMRRGILIYDLAALPEGRTLRNVIDEYNELKLVVYDSSHGQRPKIIPGRKACGVKFQDMAK